jgi:hypothetical protein
MKTRRPGRARAALVAVLFASLAGPACAPDPEDPRGGETDVVVLALQETGVATVRVIVTGPGIAAPLVVPLVRAADRWTGQIGGVPAGDNRTFVVSALDAGGREIYRQSISGVTVVANQNPLIAVMAQPPPGPPGANRPPVIDFLVANATKVAPNGTIALRASASDPDPGDTLSYAWSATAGMFSAPSSPATNWRATGGSGVRRLTVTVRDRRNARATAFVDVTASSAVTQGRSAVSVAVNTWPVVTALSASGSRVELGRSTVLDVSAADSDGDLLQYAWTCDCSGLFGAPTSRTPTFTLGVVPASGACTFTTVASDGRGGSNRGALTMAAGPEPQVNVAPQIVSTFQSGERAAPGQEVTLRVTAADPNGTALAFAWSATSGTLAELTTMGGSSEAIWTAPPAFGVPAEIRAAIRDGSGVTTMQSFAVAPP